MKKIEEVIDFLKSKEKLYSQMDDSNRKDYVMECLDAAINILSTEKTNEDLISRQAVLDLFGDIHPLDYSNRAYVSMIKELPSVEVKPIKYGKWIGDEYWSEGCGMGEDYGYYYKCSLCGNQVKGGYTSCGDKYCSKCGAEMEEE